MWYVVQVRAGTEENIRLQCEKNIDPSVLNNCFIPYYEEMKRIRGEWTICKKVLFPGYFFVVTDQVEKLFMELKHVIGLSKLVGAEYTFIPLSKEEIHFIESFADEEYVAEMSKGIIEGERTIVLGGPLKGKEGYIKKIDRHKRKAWLEVELFGRIQNIQLGLEIVSKI